MNILALAAHPDDLEILCAGTLARYVRAGHHVVMCRAGTGDKGHTTIPSAELVEMRKKEAERAAEIIGAEPLGLGYPDGGMFPENEETRLHFVDAIRQACPDLIITHHPEDYMVDHRAVSKLAFDASFLASLPYLVTDHAPIPKAPPIYHMDTLAGMGFQPAEYVDITTTMQVKRDALAQHRSQADWLKVMGDIHTLEFIEVIARFRGFQCGVAYAEGFVPCQTWLRRTPERLLP
jgi:N-acetylglucosamine malate deacetylase 1